MAFVEEVAQSIAYSFKDRDGNTGVATLYVPNAILVENVQTWATTTGYNLMLALTNASITGVHILRSLIQDDPQVASEASDVERKLVFVSKVEGGGTFRVSIPSVKNELIVDGADVAIPNDPAITAFVAALVDTGLFDTVGLGNFRGDALVGLTQAPYKKHRNSTRG